MREHDAGAAEADARRPRRDGRQKNLRRCADDRIVVVMFRDPETIVSEFFRVLREGQRLLDRGMMGPAGDGDGLVEDGKAQGQLLRNGCGRMANTA